MRECQILCQQRSLIHTQRVLFHLACMYRDQRNEIKIVISTASSESESLRNNITAESKFHHINYVTQRGGIPLLRDIWEGGRFQSDITVPKVTKMFSRQM